MTTPLSLAELIRSALDSRLLDVHTSLPGRVKAYDAATQTADIEIVVNRAEADSKGRTVSEVFPVIPNVPIAWARGGGYSMQFPLSAGDHVWLLFSEASTAQWRVSGEVSDPGDLERHGLSYPIALPCIAPDAEALPVAAGALVTVPSGGSLSVSEAGGAPSPVAMASKVDANFNAIVQMFASWVVVAMDGGAALKTLSGSLVLEPTSSANLNAE
jgi:hypothetical protein